MVDFEKAEKNLKAKGYAVQIFKTGKEAAEYLNTAIDGATVGIGGCATARDMNVYELLQTHNTVYWHWEQEANVARANAMNTDIYISSVNALAESGEMVNIDGVGNRVASTLFGHKKVYFLIGSNKLTSTYEEAVFRARNVAAPNRAKQMNAKTPCALHADRCYDCNSPARICRGMVTLWEPMMGMEAEVLLIEESFGL